MKQKGIEITVDPRARIVFASYYLRGFYELFGRNSVKFRMKPFTGLVHKGDDSMPFDHYMGFIIREGDKERRFIIDYRDKNTINERALNWCDVYGKINLNTELTDTDTLKKCVALGPMIGIRIWNKPQTLVNYLVNYQRSRKYIDVSRSYFRIGYSWQLKRPLLEDYEPVEAENDYIFFDSRLWELEKYAKVTNSWRASFIRTCKNMDIRFQGGLFGNKDHPDYDKYKDVILNEFVSTDEFVRRIKRSTLVFNTPSVHAGHGWKLGEFLAMGKAMISTPILNEMPSPLEHGVNVHFVKNEEEIREAVEIITGDPDYRKKLETGARDYHETYMAPSKVMGRLLDLSATDDYSVSSNWQRSSPQPQV